MVFIRLFLVLPYAEREVVATLTIGIGKGADRELITVSGVKYSGAVKFQERSSEI
jgi:hypothetical protein